MDESINNSIKELNQMDQNDKKSSSPTKKSSPAKKMVFDTKMGRINGVKPKFVRARELHKYLFYLTRDFNGKPGSREDMIKLSKKQGYPITEEIETELQNIDVFQTDLGWKTFIPPLPQVNSIFDNKRIHKFAGIRNNYKRSCRLFRQTVQKSTRGPQNH